MKTLERELSQPRMDNPITIHDLAIYKNLSKDVESHRIKAEYSAGQRQKEAAAEEIRKKTDAEATLANIIKKHPRFGRIKELLDQAGASTNLKPEDVLREIVAGPNSRKQKSYVRAHFNAAGGMDGFAVFTLKRRWVGMTRFWGPKAEVKMFIDHRLMAVGQYDAVEQEMLADFSSLAEKFATATKRSFDHGRSVMSEERSNFIDGIEMQKARADAAAKAAKKTASSGGGPPSSGAAPPVTPASGGAPPAPGSPTGTVSPAPATTPSSSVPPVSSTPPSSSPALPPSSISGAATASLGKSLTGRVSQVSFAPLPVHAVSSAPKFMMDYRQYLALVQGRREGTVAASKEQDFMRLSRAHFFGQMKDALNGTPEARLAAEKFVHGLGFSKVGATQLEAAFAANEVATSELAHKIFTAAHRTEAYNMRSGSDPAYATSPAGVAQKRILDRAFAARGGEKKPAANDDAGVLEFATVPMPGGDVRQRGRAILVPGHEKDVADGRMHDAVGDERVAALRERNRGPRQAWAEEPDEQARAAELRFYLQERALRRTRDRGLER